MNQHRNNKGTDTRTNNANSIGIKQKIKNMLDWKYFKHI